MITNADGRMREVLRDLEFPEELFEVEGKDLVVISEEEGVEKPDPRIFRNALERTGSRAEESLYVGDIYHIDVIGARAAGMDVVLLDPADLHGDKPVRRVRSLGALASSIDAP